MLKTKLPTQTRPKGGLNMSKTFVAIAAAGALIAASAVMPALADSNVPLSPQEALQESAGAPDLYSPYAQAIAYVGQSGLLIRAKGFSAHTHHAPGINCFTLAAGTQLQTAPQVSVEWGRSLGVVLFAQWDQANVSCPGATASTIEVRTYKGDLTGVGSGYKTPVLSDQVAFVVYVP
jgi:hypothetical protein